MSDIELFYILLAAIIRRAKQDARSTNVQRAKAAQEFLSHFLEGIEGVSV